MPRFDQDETEVMKIPQSNFTFSAVRPDVLEATEYTLVTIVTDISGSMDGLEQNIADMKKAVVKGCQKSPRAENILVRDIQFNDRLDEVHGFIPLQKINPDDYQPPYCGGSTALFDAVMSSLAATIAYAKTLMDQDYTVNAAVYIITDGKNNASVSSKSDIQRITEKIKKDELLNSTLSILIGVGDASVAQYLQDFQTNAGLTHFIDMGSVTPQKLAKLGGWVSQSISSHSQSLQNGTQTSVNTSSLTF